MQKALTLKRIAEMLSVSPTTVSRALNGYGDVSAKTRERVLEMARRLDYRPDARAQSLATGRSRAVGQVIPVTDEHEVLNPVFAEFMIGATAALSAAGYNTLLRAVRLDIEANVYRDLATQRAVDGFILHAPHVSDARIDLLQDLKLPFVVHGRVLDRSEACAWVDGDDVDAFSRATGHLIDLGHRTIGLINGPRGMTFTELRGRGFREALERHGLTPHPDLTIHADLSEPAGYQAGLQLLDRCDPPTAILTASELFALGVTRAARDRSRRLGIDLSIVTYDDGLSFLASPDREPLFTAVRVPVRRSGRRCAEVLLKMIADPQQPLVQELVPAEFVRGWSSR